jgi:dihydrofolate reductase
MRKVVFGINMTADGYCSHTDGFPDEQTRQFFVDLLRQASVILLGRVTYQLMVPFWPDVAKNKSETGALLEFARVYTGIEKVVFSTTLTQAEANGRIAQRSPVDEVLALRELPGKDISIDSLSVARQLTEHGLIDEYHILVHPVLAGRGPRLFETLSPQGGPRLELVSSKAFASGIVALHYRRRGSEPLRSSH